MLPIFKKRIKSEVKLDDPYKLFNNVGVSSKRDSFVWVIDNSKRFGLTIHIVLFGFRSLWVYRTKNHFCIILLSGLFSWDPAYVTTLKIPFISKHHITSLFWKDYQSYSSSVDARSIT